MTEQEMIVANEALAYQHEADGGHADALEADRESELLADAPASETGPFVPTDEAGVDWFLKKRAALRAEAKLIRENAETMARQLEADAKFLEWKFGAPVQTWLREVLAGSKRRCKSKTLFHGTVGFRTEPPKVEFLDTGAAMAYAREHYRDAVVESLDRKALEKRLVQTGEAVDFATLVPAEEKFYIK